MTRRRSGLAMWRRGGLALALALLLAALPLWPGLARPRQRPET
jgi:hypothetical protein